jgi:YbbR domain-containing protein
LEAVKKKRVHIIAVSILFAILLWISINMSYEYQTTVTAPLTIQSLPQGMAIKTPIPRTITLKFRGNGWRLATLLMGPELKCTIDLNSLVRGQGTIDIGDVVERMNLPLGVQPIDMNPDSLFVALEPYAEKRVPIALDPHISFRDGYGQVGSIVIKPESVTLGGAESVLKAVTSWSAGRGMFEDLKAPVDINISVADTTTNMFAVSPQKIHVAINVQPLVEKVFSGLSVEVRGEQLNREVILIPPKIEIVVRGAIDQLSVLGVNDFRATVDYNVILSDTTGFTEVEIMPPAGVQIVARRPERLQYIVRTRL